MLRAAGLRVAFRLERRAVYRGSQNPGGLQALAAGLPVVDGRAPQGVLQVYEERAWVAGDFPAAAFPGRSAAWSFALRVVVPLLTVAAFFAPVAV
jgi:hypothetical protein